MNPPDIPPKNMKSVTHPQKISTKTITSPSKLESKKIMTEQEQEVDDLLPVTPKQQCIKSVAHPQKTSLKPPASSSKLTSSTPTRRSPRVAAKKNHEMSLSKPSSSALLPVYENDGKFLI